MSTAIYTLRQTVHSGSGNETSFGLIKSDGSPLDLSTLVSAIVEVSVNNPGGENWEITSGTSDVRFDGDTLYVKFGQLNLPAGTYYPKISYTYFGSTAPEVISGYGMKTEIILKSYKES